MLLDIFLVFQQNIRGIGSTFSRLNLPKFILSPIRKGVHSKRKELAFRVNLFSEKVWCEGNEKQSHESYFPFNPSHAE